MKPNDIIAFTRFCKIQAVETDGKTVLVRDLDTGADFGFRGTVLQDMMSSADKFEETVKMCLTDVAKMLCTTYNTPFTVAYETKHGKKRTLRGRLLSSDSYQGRCTVEDLDAPADDRIRQVDNRTIESLIINNVKYVVK
jgi:hypothetical protein